jgi:hypothetical protein
MVPIAVFVVCHTVIPTAIAPLETAVTVNTVVALDAVNVQAFALAAQFAVFALVQLPVPPRQYLLAIMLPDSHI